MTDPITKRTISLLASSNHIFTPLTELYSTLVSEGLMPWFDISSFAQFIATDAQFLLLTGLGDLEALAPVLNIDLDIEDFWDDPLVMLRSRATSPQVVIQDVLYYMHEMNTALEEAWHSRPANDPVIEAELIGMLMMGDMLERELRDALQLHAAVDNPEPDGRRKAGDA